MAAYALCNADTCTVSTQTHSIVKLHAVDLQPFQADHITICFDGSMDATTTRSISITQLFEENPANGVYTGSSKEFAFLLLKRSQKKVTKKVLVTAADDNTTRNMAKLVSFMFATYGPRVVIEATENKSTFLSLCNAALAVMLHDDYDSAYAIANKSQNVIFTGNETIKEHYSILRHCSRNPEQYIHWMPQLCIAAAVIHPWIPLLTLPGRQVDVFLDTSSTHDSAFLAASIATERKLNFVNPKGAPSVKGFAKWQSTYISDVFYCTHLQEVKERRRTAAAQRRNRPDAATLQSILGQKPFIPFSKRPKSKKKPKAPKKKRHTETVEDDADNNNNDYEDLDEDFNI